MAGDAGDDCGFHVVSINCFQSSLFQADLFGVGVNFDGQLFRESGGARVEKRCDDQPAVGFALVLALVEIDLAREGVQPGLVHRGLDFTGDQQAIFDQDIQLHLIGATEHQTFIVVIVDVDDLDAETFFQDGGQFIHTVS